MMKKETKTPYKQCSIPKANVATLDLLVRLVISLFFGKIQEIGHLTWFELLVLYWCNLGPPPLLIG